jgi:proline iminopeptidase
MAGMEEEPLRRSLYPKIEANHSGMIGVGNGHRLYYEESGNPGGKAVVFLHGGPGGGCNEDMRRFFNPDVYRIVLFDQRGCGKSTPHASQENNTTWDLVGDIEILREALQVERWQVFGGSWGSTLALAYAQTHPGRVSELVLRGIFTARRAEVSWLYQYGTSEFFPERWERFLEPIPGPERDDLVSAYYRQLTAEDSDARLFAARAWAQWEAGAMALVPDDRVLSMFAGDDTALAMARIECHYFVNHCFMEEGQLLANIDRVRDIPAVIVHGRYDALCPVSNAWELSRLWPEAELHIVPDAGHTAFEAGNIHELVTATDKFTVA